VLRLYHRTKRSDTKRRSHPLDFYIIALPHRNCKRRSGKILKSKKPGNAGLFCACLNEQKHDNISIRASFTPLELDRQAQYLKGAYTYRQGYYTTVLNQ
jgi:hypothetical protein